MKQDIKQLWIDALKSGNYKQCVGGLRLGNGYCCLGVLTDLYIKQTGKGKWEVYKGCESFRFVSGEYEEGGTLPLDVAEWAGLEIPDESKFPLIDVTFDEGNSAVTMNDEGKDFIEIAAAIEKHV